MTQTGARRTATRNGLGERRKAAGQAAARDMIYEIAEGLFFERGFDEVTFEQIAEACGVSVRTVLRYFPGKEMLALARPMSRLEEFKAGLRTRSGDVLSFWRAHVLAELSTHSQDGGAHLRQHMKMTGASPTLRAHSAAIAQTYEQSLAEALAEESGDPGFGPRMLAAVLVTGNLAAGRYWFSHHSRFDPSLHMSVIDFAEESVLSYFET